MQVVGESVHFISVGLYSARTAQGHAVVYMTVGAGHQSVAVMLNNGVQLVRFALVKGQAIRAQIDAEMARLREAQKGITWLPIDESSEREWPGIVELAQSDVLKPPLPAFVVEEER